MRMTEDQARAMFLLAGIEVLAIRPLPDGYHYKPSDPRYFESPPLRVVVREDRRWLDRDRLAQARYLDQLGGH